MLVTCWLLSLTSNNSCMIMQWYMMYRLFFTGNHAMFSALMYNVVCTFSWHLIRLKLDGFNHQKLCSNTPWPHTLVLTQSDTHTHPIGYCSCEVWTTARRSQMCWITGKTEEVPWHHRKLLPEGQEVCSWWPDLHRRPELLWRGDTVLDCQLWHLQGTTKYGKVGGGMPEAAESAFWGDLQYLLGA